MTLSDTNLPRGYRNITGLVLGCRECIRTVWNSYFRMLFDAEHCFRDVEDVLMESMIYSKTAEPITQTSSLGFQYAANIGVKPSSPSGLTEILVPEELPTRVKWTRSLISLEDLDLRFGEFFDFVTFDEEYRDFEFVEVIIVGNGSTEFRIGDRLLVQALKLEYFDLSVEEDEVRPLTT